MRLFIIRHGDPNYDNGSFLTEKGKKEAAALASYLPRLHLTHLYTSPLGRARETAAPCAEKLGLPVTILPWAHELEGVIYETERFGLVAPHTMPGELMYSIAPVPLYEGWQTQKYFDHPHLIKSISQMEEGADALLKQHGFLREGPVYRVIRPNEERVAVFCHQGLGTSLIAYLLKIPYQAAWSGMWQACSSISTLIMECRSDHYAAPRMIQMGSTPHIDLAGLEPNENGLQWIV